MPVLCCFILFISLSLWCSQLCHAFPFRAFCPLPQGHHNGIKMNRSEIKSQSKSLPPFKLTYSGIFVRVTWSSLPQWGWEIGCGGFKLCTGILAWLTLDKANLGAGESIKSLETEPFTECGWFRLILVLWETNRSVGIICWWSYYFFDVETGSWIFSAYTMKYGYGIRN